VSEDSDLVGNDASDYSVTKRDADAALAAVDGMTRVLVRPPAILGPGETSIRNSLRPRGMRDHEAERHALPDATFAWVHIDDLATLIADVATGQVAPSDDPAKEPVTGDCTPLNVAAGPATQRDYYETVTRALGVAAVWDDEPGWTGSIVALPGESNTLVRHGFRATGGWPDGGQRRRQPRVRDGQARQWPGEVDGRRAALVCANLQPSGCR
jgi:nucleoside-diphosphate-sugar epimerase